MLAKNWSKRPPPHPRAYSWLQWFSTVVEQYGSTADICDISDNSDSSGTVTIGTEVTVVTVDRNKAKAISAELLE